MPLALLAGKPGVPRTGRARTARVCGLIVAAAMVAAPLAASAPAHAAVGPFSIPDVSDAALGAGPGNAARLSIAEFDATGPRFRSPVVWTVRAGRRITKRPLTASALDGRETLTPTGAVVAHAQRDTGRVAVARLDLHGRVRSDVVVSDAGPAAAPSASPVVSENGTVAVLYRRPPGDGIAPQWLTVDPGGRGAWTTPVALPRGEYATRLALTPGGRGAVLSVPLSRDAGPLLIQRIASDGALGAPVPVDVSALLPALDAASSPTSRSSSGFPINSALAVTDHGTVVAALSVPGLHDDRHRSHLALVTVGAEVASAVLHDAGKGVDSGGGVGTLDVVASGADRATVIAGDGAHALRVFDAAAAADGRWSSSTVPSRFVKGGRAFRRAAGGVSIVWAEARSTGMSDGRLMATHRAAERGAFVTPHRLSASPRARGRLDLWDAVRLANDEVLVTYGRYGRSGGDDRAYALVARP